MDEGVTAEVGRVFVVGLLVREGGGDVDGDLCVLLPLRDARGVD